MKIGRLAGKWIRNGYDSFEKWRSYSNSRNQADRYRHIITKEKGAPFVDRKLIKTLKEYSEARYNDPGHWHWLALYSELREEFIEGWLPDDIYTYKLIPKLNPPKIHYLSTMKSFDHRIFGSFAIQPIFTKIHGQYYDAKQERVSESEFFSAMNSAIGEVVIKRDSSPSGKEIEFKEPLSVSADDFREGFNYLIQPAVTQHPDLSEIYRESVNTLRVTTYLKRTGEIDIKHLSLRVGTGGCRIVNVSRGGLCIYLDSNGSVTSEVVDDIGLHPGNRHPDTGFLFENLKVPSVPKAIAKCRESHLKFPYLRLIAWDLYIDTKQEPRMIEWNAVRPDMWVDEAITGPLWSEEEIDDVLGQEWLAGN